MIIDVVQKSEGPELSYVTEDGRIDIVPVTLIEGYYQYTACDDYDSQKITNIKSFRNSAIKKEEAKYFTHHNVNEFLGIDLRENYPDVYKLVSPLRMPLPFSVDIETEITDEFGYSSVEDVENRVLSISVTDIEMGSILFIIKNPLHPDITESDKLEIDTVLIESLGSEFYSKYQFDYNIRIFDDEIDMLNTFFECINKYFHSIIGWNFIGYDWQYLFNRAKKLGIDPKKASPKNRLTKKSLEINDHEKLDYEIPTHRTINDYMMFFKDSQKYANLEAYSLNYVSEFILGLNKVAYDGNLRTLYETNYPKFIGYAFIDTILVMLLHKATNLYNSDFFQSYYTNVPYQKISQNSISEALIYNELRSQNIFLLESEKNVGVKRKYIGGYVKAPTKKFVESISGLDFNALYPFTIITVGLSPEMKVDSIEVNEDGFPANVIAQEKWNKYKSMGYCLSPMGRIYDVTTDGLYVRIEKKLQKERKIFKNHKEDIYINVIPMIEAEMLKRGMKVPKYNEDK